MSGENDAEFIEVIRADISSEDILAMTEEAQYRKYYFL